MISKSKSNKKVFVAMSPKNLPRRISGQAGAIHRKVVFVAMSGGVDSSVAAYRLVKQGYQVVGVFMRCVGGDPSTMLRAGGPDAAVGASCAEQDAEDARRVAEKLKIPFYVWDFEKEYKARVVKYMIEGYRRGITPNPDVECNREIKFGLFFERALEAGADFIATGHYVRIAQANSKGQRAKSKKDKAKSLYPIGYTLLAARDAQKDQSYFLWTLTQKQLTRSLFPIGEYTKPQVRAIARRARLSTAGKKDSQGICFLGKFSVSDFLKTHIRSRRGAIVTLAGDKIGEHDGAQFYTIGQRHGLNLSDKRHVTSSKGDSKAHYVVAKDLKKNTITVAEGEDNPALYTREVKIKNINIINPNYSLIPAKGGQAYNKRIVRVSVLARVRYRQPLSPATITYLQTPVYKYVIVGKSRMKKAITVPHVPRTMSLIFKKPQKFVAPGQSAVFYAKNGEMLGGGLIR